MEYGDKWTYKYYIWDPSPDQKDDNIGERIQKALADAGLECEYDTIEDYE